MVYLTYLLLFFVFFIIIKANKIRKETLFFYGHYISIAMMGVEVNILSAAVIAYFIPVHGVTLETLFLVILFGIIILISGIQGLLEISKRRKNG